MAPKKPKKPTMLQRQRALRKMTQERKARSSKQLPPKGNTSANSRQARSQRTTTAKAQAANQQRVIARGMEGFVRRGKAMDKLDKAAKGTKGSGTRTAGAGGGLAKRPSSTVQRRQTTASTPKGGAVATQARGSLGGQRSLPRGRRGGSLEKAGPTIDVKAKPPRSAQPIRNPNGTTGKQARQLAEGLPNRGRTPSRGGVTARTATSAVRNAATRGAGRLSGAAKGAGRIALPLAILNQAADVMRVGRQNQRWNEYKERMGMNQKPSTNAPRSNTRKQRAKPPTVSIPKPSPRDRQGRRITTTTTKPQGKDWRDKVSSSNVDKLRQGQNDTIRSYAGKTSAAKPKPQPKAPTRTSGRTSAPSRTSSAPTKPRFTGTVDEGRRIWAEKYSSSKYEGQAIQKEAKALLEKMKKRKEEKSAAQRAGWDGNKNY